MVTGEIALALFLLVGTGLLLRGIFLIDHQHLGFQADHLLTAGITLDSARYKDDSQQNHFVQDLISRLQNQPGAEAVAATSDLPATGMSSVTLHLQGQSDQPSSQPMTTGDCVITPDYLGTAGVSLLRGRAFTEDDNVNAPRVVLVNQEFVHKYLHDQDPLATRIRLEVIGAPSQWSQIVGVVSNVKWYSESRARNRRSTNLFCSAPHHPSRSCFEPLPTLTSSPPHCTKRSRKWMSNFRWRE
jgi:putative ABC transport system permease protein